MNRAAQLYGLRPQEILDLDTADFHGLMAWAVAADRDNTEDLRRMLRRAKKDDMAPGIASAASAGGKAAR